MKCEKCGHEQNTPPSQDSFRGALKLIACYDVDAPYCAGWKNAARTMQHLACHALGVAKGFDLPDYQRAQQTLAMVSEEDATALDGASHEIEPVSLAGHAAEFAADLRRSHWLPIPVYYAVREGDDWKEWRHNTTPAPPTQEEVSKLAPHNGYAEWGGVHFRAIRFGDGSSDRIWDVVTGWQKTRHAIDPGFSQERT
jgi:hypothetical protein